MAAPLNKCCVPSAPEEIPRGVFTLKIASSLDSAAPWETIKMMLSFTHFSSQTVGWFPDHDANLSPCLCICCAFFPGAFPSNGTPGKCLLHVTSACLSQHPPQPVSQKTYTLWCNYLFSRLPPNQIIASPREYLQLQHLARTRHRTEARPGM